MLDFFSLWTETGCVALQSLELYPAPYFMHTHESGIKLFDLTLGNKVIKPKPKMF